MPGMMDTVLNVGINDKVREGLATLTNNLRFACDCHRRFLEMLGETVLKIEKSKFEGVQSTAADLGDEWTIAEYKRILSEAIKGTDYERILDDP